MRWKGNLCETSSVIVFKASASLSNGVTRLFKDGTRCSNFYGVAKRGAGAMHLQPNIVGRCHVTCCERLDDDVVLGRPVWSCETA